MAPTSPPAMWGCRDRENSRKGQKMKEQTKSMKNRNIVTMLATGLLACFGFLPQTNAAPEVVPAARRVLLPDSPQLKAAKHCSFNIARPWKHRTWLAFALFQHGAAASTLALALERLALNTDDDNTAVGAVALLLNTSGSDNTAVGNGAMIFNDTGGANTASAFKRSRSTPHTSRTWPW